MTVSLVVKIQREMSGLNILSLLTKIDESEHKKKDRQKEYEELCEVIFFFS